MVAVVACGKPAASPNARLLPSRPVVTASGKKLQLPEWSYWEPYALSLTPAQGPVPELPQTVAAIARTTGSERVFADLPQKELLLRRGFYTMQRPTFARIGDRYAEWARAGVPVFITLDTLFFLTHVAIDRAYAEAEATLLGPRFDAVLARLEMSLGAQAKNASADLVDAYAMARGVLAVAAALAHPRAGASGSEVAEASRLRSDVDVQRELELVRAHRGMDKSPLLGVPIDYSLFSSPAPGLHEVERDGRSDALAWLSLAPFALAGKTEQAASPATVGQARVATRAMLLLARAVDSDVDPISAKQFASLQRFRRFAFGAADDASVPDVDRVAERLGLDLADPKVVVDITKVDRLRHAVTLRWNLHVDDGTGAPAPGPEPGPPTVYARLFGKSGTEDAEVLAALVSPPLRLPDPERRPLPSGLDVIAWLGSAEAKASVLPTGDERRAAYDQALAALGQRRSRSDESQRHHSVYASLLDAIGTYVEPSAGDATNLVLGRPPEWPPQGRGCGRRMDDAPSRCIDVRPLSARRGSRGRRALSRRSSITVVMVEPHPGGHLEAGGAPGTGCPRHAGLRRLRAHRHRARDAHRGRRHRPHRAQLAVRSAEGTPLDGELQGRAGSLPYRMADLEMRLAASGAVDTALVADVHHDLRTNAVLHVATGTAQDLAILGRTAAGESLQLAMGVALPLLRTGAGCIESPRRRRLAKAPRRSRAAAYLGGRRLRHRLAGARETGRAGGRASAPQALTLRIETHRDCAHGHRFAKDARDRVLHVRPGRMSRALPPQAKAKARVRKRCL